MSLCLLLLALGATPAPASFGKDVIFKSTDSGPATFSFFLPPKDSFILLFIVNPFGDEVFFLSPNGNFNKSSSYENRIDGPQFQNGTVTFSLKNVTREDAGIYRCRKGSPTGPEIPDCGQRLQYIEEDQNASKAPTSLPDMMTSVGSTLATTDTGNTGSPSEHQTQNVEAIVGGVIGGVVLIVIAVGIVYWKRKKPNAEGNSENNELNETRPEQPDTPDDSDGANADQPLPREQIPREVEENVSEPPE